MRKIFVLSLSCVLAMAVFGCASITSMQSTTAATSANPILGQTYYKNWTHVEWNDASDEEQQYIAKAIVQEDGAYCPSDSTAQRFIQALNRLLAQDGSRTIQQAVDIMNEVPTTESIAEG